MDDKPEVIRHRIDETRSALTEKLETLEREVRGTVCEARDAVTCTVETVRDTVNSTLGGVRETVSSTVETVRDQVQDTMCSVKEALNVQRQVQAHPWVMLGGSVAAGYLLGTLLPQRGNNHGGHEHPSSSSSRYAGTRPYEPERASSWSEPTPASSRTPGFLSGIADQLAPEIQKVKGMAIGAAMGLVRDLLKQQIPEQLAGNVDEVLDSVTTKLGGEPVRGSVLEAFTSAGTEQCRSSREPSFARAGGGREDPGERRFDM